jgi:hypothetical protein
MADALVYLANMQQQTLIPLSSRPVLGSAA